jgi:hypothetical protein
VKLTQAERDALADVLEPNYSVTRKNTPALQPLSMYSSELKGLKQIANLLQTVSTTGELAPDATTRARYFNTLSNQGLIEGTSEKPILTVLAKPFLDYLATNPSDDDWRSPANGLELALVRALAESLSRGVPVSEQFRRVWLNVQTVFEYVPVAELDSLLQDSRRVLDLFRINSVGWEIPRYFRLQSDDREKFDAAFAKVPKSSEWAPTFKIERSASAYKDAAAQYQADVRFRIAGFMQAYATLRDELGADFPYLNRAMEVRSARSQHAAPPSVAAAAHPLRHPLQLIVTGCPGSGKSHFVDKIATDSGAVVFRTQFHPESTFFDFVGAYKPQPIYEAAANVTLLEADGTSRSGGRPLIDYRFVPGPFIRALVHALKNPSDNVVLIIEELNRANAAAVFGDILQLLDRAGDGRSKYEIMSPPDLQAHLSRLGLPSSALCLPPNLYLWATMNSADQGVFPLDTAFRRRWSYVYKGYMEPCMCEDGSQPTITYGGKSYLWDSFRANLNQRLIELGIHEDKLIGPYFLTAQQMTDSSSVLEKLFLYLWDDVLRFRQDELFLAKSFSQVAANWGNGTGAPLTFELPAPTILAAGGENAAEVTESSLTSEPVAVTADTPTTPTTPTPPTSEMA